MDITSAAFVNAKVLGCMKEITCNQKVGHRVLCLQDDTSIIYDDRGAVVVIDEVSTGIVASFPDLDSGMRINLS